MKSTNKAYVWARDRERFDDEEFPSRAEAEHAGLAENPLAPYIWTGVKVLHRPIIHAADVLERLGEGAYEAAGEFSDNWPDSSPEQEAELGSALNAVLSEWLTRHDQHPRFFTVDEIRRHDRG